MKLDADKLYLYVQGLDPEHLMGYLGGMVYLGILTAQGGRVGPSLFKNPEAPTLEDLHHVADVNTAHFEATIRALGFDDE